MMSRNLHRALGGFRPMAVAGLCVALLALAGPRSFADIYAGGNFAAPDLILNSGSIVFDTTTLATTPGTATADLDDGVAVFRYKKVDVGAGVTVTVVGTRPLAITASGDMVWEADIDASGNVPGRAGGGTGGAGGGGGATGGTGGAGGDGAGGGGGATAGGRGGLRSGNPSASGESGAGRNSGADGVSGAAGAAGGAGSTGSNGALGAGTSGAAAGAVGTGGGGGGGGVPPVSSTNSGVGSTASGGGGAGSVGTTNSAAAAGGDATQAGLAGGGGTVGVAGGNASDGSPGGAATFTTPANTLALAGGTGGGGGGGGGKGAGGQGGGQGGGGSSGAAGGGGGSIDGVNECTGAPAGNVAAIDGEGANGLGGGSGGTGGRGGDGGTALDGATGVNGYGGGGAVLLSSKGLLRFGGTLNISAAALGATPGVGAAQAGATGLGGGGGGSVEAPTALNTPTTAAWNYVSGPYCFRDGSSTLPAGASGNGTTGGNGGGGGTGGASGTSGDAGQGGRGTPGMVKLHGSVVLAGSGTVEADNGPGAAADQNGKFTLISNMEPAAVTANLPIFSTANIVTGSLGNNPLLRAAAPYSVVTQIPIIPELVGGPATGGILPATYYNDALITPLFVGTLPFETQLLLDVDTVFDGFDQLVVKNNSASVLTGAQVVIGSFGAYNLPNIGVGEVWTTLVPAGTTVGSVNPIVITSNPTPSDVYVNDPFSVSVTATGGNGALAYQWNLDGVPILGANSDTYSVAAAQLSDAGRYTCTVSDTGIPPAPSATSFGADVGVFEPLSITQDPIGGVRFTSPPSTFTFFVGTNGGLRTVNYEWFLNGSPIVGASNSPVYYINPVTESAGGLYSVRVTDLGTGDILSGEGELSVNPLTIIEQPVDVVVSTPDPASMSIAIQGGRTLDGVVPILYQWYEEDGTPVAGATTDTLTFNPSSIGDTGGYYCIVTDAAGPVQSNTGNVLVLTPLSALSIVQQPQDANAAQGQAVTFSVAVIGGSGTVNYVWKKDGDPIVGAPNSPIYTIPFAGSGDAGDYSVDVSDDLTTLQSDTAVLTVDAAGVPAFAPLGLAAVGVALGLAAAARLRKRGRA